MDKELAPIILFVYNRPIHTKKTVESLLKNDLASNSILYIFADGRRQAATLEQQAKICEVRNYIHSIKGFKQIIYKEAPSNKGLAKSVIDGVTEVINIHKKAIIIEDDIITHRFFLRFMNSCLETYEKRKDIYMVSGYTPNIHITKNYKEKTYLVHRSCSWGWATWIDRWNQADWDVKDFIHLLADPTLQIKFNRGGNDLFPMLCAQMSGEIDSWAIRWDYTMFKHDAVCLHPTKNLCVNCGFDSSGEHCKKVHRNYTTTLYNGDENQWELNQCIKANIAIEKEYAYIQQTRGRHLPTNFIEVTITNILQQIKYCHRNLDILLHNDKAPYGAVLYFHNLGDSSSQSGYNEDNLNIAPHTISKMIKYAKENRCKFVSIDTIVAKQHLWEHPHKLIALTTNDNNFNNYTIGARILDMHKVPYCIYTGAEQQKITTPSWIIDIEDFVRNNDNTVIITKEDNTEVLYDCSTIEKKEQTLLDIYTIILNLNNDPKSIIHLFSKYTQLCSRLRYDIVHMLCQNKNLIDNPLCTIGIRANEITTYNNNENNFKDAIIKVTKTAKEHLKHFEYPTVSTKGLTNQYIRTASQFNFITASNINYGYIRYGLDFYKIPRILVTNKNWEQVINKIIGDC